MSKSRVLGAMLSLSYSSDGGITIIIFGRGKCKFGYSYVLNMFTFVAMVAFAVSLAALLNGKWCVRKCYR